MDTLTLSSSTVAISHPRTSWLERTPEMWTRDAVRRLASNVIHCHRHASPSLPEA